MSIATFLNGLGYLLGKIPLQERKERWKNEIDKLTIERKELIRVACTAKSADRVIKIDTRIAELNQFLKNSSDAK